MLSTQLLRICSQIWLPRWQLLISVSKDMISKAMISKAMIPKTTALSAPLIAALLPVLLSTALASPMLLSKALASPVLMPQPASVRTTTEVPVASPVLMPLAWTVHIKGPAVTIEGESEGKTETTAAGAIQLPALAVLQKLQPALSFSTTAQAQAMLQIRYQQQIRVPAFGDDESYQLHVGKSSAGVPQIRLDAPSSTGVLYGLMTLSQLLDCPAAPPHSADLSLADQQKANSIQTDSTQADGAQTNKAKTNSAKTNNTQSLDSAVCRLPQLQIHDNPRFGWRGLLLDSARRFIPLADIRRTLDGMAAAKLNVLHWHLTDDQAWRLESRVYPKLQQMASQGQYYRQSDVRELVQYASARGIRLVPELDVPGHAWAIGQAYPELLAWPDDQAPAPLPPQPGFGVFTAVLDPSKAEVWQFLQALIEEWRDLFPDAFLHIGGDEVKPDHWLASGRVKAYMAEHQLADAHALQAFFNQQLAARLSKAGRRMVGWDEVLHPALPKSTVVQSWQGQDALGAAVRAGHPALLSAGFYLDMPQPAFYHWTNDPLQVTAPLPELAQMQQAWQFSFSLQRLNQKPVSGQIRLYRQQAGDRGSQIGKLDAAQPDSQWTASIESHGRGAVPATVRWLADGQLLQLSADNYLGPLQFELPLSVNQLQQLAQSPSSQAMSAQQAASAPALPPVISAATPGASSAPVSESAPAQQPAASLQRSGLGRVGNHQYPLTVRSVAYQPLAPLAPLTAQEQQLLWGGEAALWTELVSPQLLDTKLWPRLFVVAERFWSPAAVLAELAAPVAITAQAGVKAPVALTPAERFNQRLAALDDYAARIGLLHRQQSQALLNQFSVNATEQQALKDLSPYLQPLHYYGRHHVKTVAGRYNLHEPLDQLADALLLEPPALLQLSADFAGTAACQLPASWPAHQARLQQLSAQLANYQGPAAQELQALLAQQQRLNLALQAFAEPAAYTLPARRSAKTLSADNARRSQLRRLLDTVQQPSGEVVLALPAPVRAWLARCEAVK